jgi:membrane-bound metal-dependent hydrolase YbcI (DUF457 family)
MAAPFGHAAIGMLIARRLGVRSRAGLAAAALAASLPDIDIPLGLVLHGDPWKLHRGATHTANFALTAGALAGLAGILSAGNIDGERDLVADAVTGAAIVGSHLALDAVPYVPDARLGPVVIGLPLVNWAIDALQWGAVAWLLWPREQRAAPAPIDN